MVGLASGLNSTWQAYVRMDKSWQTMMHFLPA